MIVLTIIEGAEREREDGGGDGQKGVVGRGVRKGSKKGEGRGRCRKRNIN